MSKKHYTHIRDGFTRKGFINGLDDRGRQLTGELHFTYRPMLPGQRDSFTALIREEKNPQKVDVLFGSMLAKQLVDWSAEFEDGTPVPLNVENVRRLPPFLYDKIYYIVIGREPSDPLPEPKSPEDDTWAAEVRSAAEAGAYVGDLALVGQQKN